MRFLQLQFITILGRIIKHWIDADKDCQNTRQEVLIAESLEKVTLDKKGCEVIKGKWHDAYTDKYFTYPNDLDIDHFVPLGEVDKSGGHEWPKNRKMKYANDLDDPEVLIAVDKSVNRSKGDKDPSDWLPPNKNINANILKLGKKSKNNGRLRWMRRKRLF